MPEQIISGSGTAYPLIVNPDGSLNFAGTISATIGSESFIYGKSGTDWIPALVTAEGKLETTASVGGISVGSVQLSDSSGVNLYFDGGKVPVSGTVQQGTIPWIITGSTTSYGIGSIYGIGIGSMFALVTGSIEIKTSLPTIGSFSVQNVAGSVYTLGSINIASTTLGSVYILTSLPEIGSYTTQTITGSVNIASTLMGSVYIATGVSTIGSYSVQQVAGSIAVSGTVPVSQITDPWRITGSIISYGVGSIIGSVYQAINPWLIGGSIYSIGSINIASTTMGSMYLASTTLGSVYIKTTLTEIGSYSVQNIAGSIYSVGSIMLSNAAIEELNSLYVGGISATIIRTPFTNSTSGTALQVVAATAGSKITVLAYNAMCMSGTTAANNFVFKDASTEISGWKYLSSNTGIVTPYNPKGWFQVGAGGSLCQVANGTGSYSGELTYIKHA